MSERKALIMLDLLQNNPTHEQLAQKIDEQLTEVESERDRLQAELSKLKAEVEGARKGLTDIQKHCQIMMPHGFELMTTYLIAAKALSDQPGAR